VGINGLDGGDLVGTTIVEPNKWSNIVLTVSQTRVALYLNGEVEDARALDAPLASLVLGDAAIGAWNNGGTTIDREMAGQMDDVLIYSRGLSTAEVRYLAGFRATPVDPGIGTLVVSYAMENDVMDSSVNELHGTIVGDPSFVEGPLGMALMLDGVDDLVDLGNPSNLDFGTGDFTVSGWINMTAIERGTVYAKGADNSGGIRYTLAMGESNDNKMTLTTDDDSTKRQARGATIVNDGLWHHVVGMRRGATSLVYVDGEQDGTIDLPDGYDLSGASQTNAYIGAIDGDADPAVVAFEKLFNGTLDEVMVYGRALSDGEIRYLAGYRPDTGVPAPVGHWTFNEGAGDMVADISGNGNDGIIDGNPTWIDGVEGTALEFHGLGAAGGGGDYINCGSDPSLDIAGPISIALWIRPDAEDPEGQGTTTAPMAKAMSGISPWNWQVRYGWNSPQPYMAFTFNTSPRAWAYVNQNLTQYEWCHIACSHDGETLKCYLNGVETDSTPMGGIATGEAPVLIGSDGWGCDWIGAIDDVRIYDVGLSEDEILDVAAGL
jgi:hypothetical protein